MTKKRIALILILALVLLAATSVLTAAQVDGYDLAWWTVDAGGGQSIAPGYTLDGTIGQPDAGPSLADSTYTLSGGYWGSVTPGEQVYLPLLRKR